MLLAGCGDNSQLPEQASTGSNPTIPAPQKSYIPTVNIAPAKGWPHDGKPEAAASLAANTFAKDLEHPRWLYVLPNGDVLVAESNGPERPDDAKGVKGWIMAPYRSGRGPARKAPTASRCCATPTATASPKPQRVPHRTSIRLLAWR